MDGIWGKGARVGSGASVGITAGMSTFAAKLPGGAAAPARMGSVGIGARVGSGAMAGHAGAADSTPLCAASVGGNCPAWAGWFSWRASRFQPPKKPVTLRAVRVILALPLSFWLDRFVLAFIGSVFIRLVGKYVITLLPGCDILMNQR